MTSQQVSSLRTPPEAPYFTLDMHEQRATDTVEVLLTGELDELTVGHLDDSLVWVVDHMSHRHVVVDLSDLTRLEPCGLETLARFRRQLVAARRTLVVRGGPPTSVPA